MGSISMREAFTDYLESELANLKTEGLYKPERVIQGQQQDLVDLGEQ